MCMFGEIETFQTPYQKRCEERQYQGTTYCDNSHEQNSYEKKKKK